MTTYGYNAQGYLSTATFQPSGGSAASFYTVNSTDPTQSTTTTGDTAQTSTIYDLKTGRVTGITTPGLQGLRYSYDGLGNMTSRADGIANLTEDFAYDADNRLSTAYKSTDQTGVGFGYDALGNMTYRSDLGVMAYGGSIGATSYGPHQLRTLTVNQQADGTQSPWYTQLSSDSRSVSPNSFNQPASLTVGGTMVYQYAYDGQHQRAIETDLKTGSVTDIARWGVGYSETTVNSDNTVDTSDYVVVGGRTVGKYWHSTKSGSTPQTLYFHTDVVGSITAISGSTTVFQSFDPYGKQRYTNTGADPGCALPVTEKRSFIGEVALSQACGMINLNARLYDSLSILRFYWPFGVCRGGRSL